MRQGLGTRAYTIIEVLIVLGVTSALIVAALVSVAGQQNKTEFSQAAHEIESQISDIINDVSTGFYPNTNNFSCTSIGNGPILSTAASNDQGANKDCIFMGRVMQFALAGNNENYNSYTVVGQRQQGGNEVTKFSEAKPVAIAPTNNPPANFPNATQQNSLQFSLKAVKMFINNAERTTIGAVGFFSTLANYTSNNLASGTTSVDLIPIPGTSLNASAADTVEAINSINDATAKNPAGGVIICFLSGGTSQYGVITIGSSGRQLSTKLDILTTAEATDPTTGVCR